jgi:prepilin-type processing-associated H-X9-DG protein/prepilin-type N-terminal cleavage/methylation domain-containing protein
MAVAPPGGGRVRRAARPARRGFTLVELLVMISIIAMLLALLIPAVSSANSQSRTIQCLSNLRQLSLAAIQYCNSNSGAYPMAYYSVVRPPLVIGYNWDFTTTTNLLTGHITVQPGLLWPGFSAAPVQQCPSYDGGSNTVADPFTGYNYNSSYIGGGSTGALSMPPMRAVKVLHPSRCALFGDGQYYGGADKFMRSPYAGPVDLFFGFTAASAGTQAFRHRGQTNVAFCDGHAESLPDCYTQTSDTHPVGPGTGFLSADNSFYSGH